MGLKGILKHSDDFEARRKGRESCWRKSGAAVRWYRWPWWEHRAHLGRVPWLFQLCRGVDMTLKYVGQWLNPIPQFPKVCTLFVDHEPMQFFSLHILISIFGDCHHWALLLSDENLWGLRQNSVLLQAVYRHEKKFWQGSIKTWKWWHD